MKFLAILSITFLVTACSPRTHYLGDLYPPTDHVDVYYDEHDIEKDFKVIGQLSGDNDGLEYISLDKIKEGMIVEAKERGADGIWFLFSDSFDSNHVVKAKLVKYRT